MRRALSNSITDACHLLGPPSPRRLLAARRYDAFLIGYPKVGNTWFQVLIRKAFVVHYGLSDDWLPRILNKRSNVPASVLPVTVSHNLDTTDVNYVKYQEMVIETSFLKGKKLVLLIRDPKDALVSFYMHTKHHYTPPLYQGESPDEMVYDDVFGIETFLKYYKEMYKARDVVAGMQLIRYEDMREDPHRLLKETLEFLGLTGVTDSTVQETVDYGTFENMRRLEDENALGVHGFLKSENTKEPEQSRRVREGKVGGHRAHLSPETIAHINARVRSELPAFYGYPIGKTDS